jgi:hypothetical protein
MSAATLVRSGLAVATPGLVQAGSRTLDVVAGDHRSRAGHGRGVIAARCRPRREGPGRVLDPAQGTGRSCRWHKTEVTPAGCSTPARSRAQARDRPGLRPMPHARPARARTRDRARHHVPRVRTLHDPVRRELSQAHLLDQLHAAGMASQAGWLTFRSQCQPVLEC